MGYCIPNLEHLGENTLINQVDSHRGKHITEHGHSSVLPTWTTMNVPVVVCRMPRMAMREAIEMGTAAFLKHATGPVLLRNASEGWGLLDWSDELCSLASIDRSMLSEIAASGARTGQVTPDAAAARSGQHTHTQACGEASRAGHIARSVEAAFALPGGAGL